MAGYSDTSQRLKIRNEEFQSAPLKHFQSASDQYSITLRKAKRKKSHNKKRQIHSSPYPSALSPPIQSLISQPLPRSAIFTSIFSLPSPPHTQQELLRGLQQILSPKLKKEPGAEINPEQILCLIQLLEFAPVEDRKIILEILINCYYFYSINIEGSLDAKSIEVLYKLLNEKHEEIVRNTVWLITNMVANDKNLKTCLGRKGFGMLLVEIFNKLDEEESISILLWAMKIFFKEFSQFKGNWVLKLIQRIKHTLRYCKEKSLKIAISILYYIANQNSEFIDCFFSYGVISELWQYLKSEHLGLTSAILNLLNLISSSDNEHHTQVLLDLNILSELSVLSASEHPTIRKLAFFGYSNIAAGSRAQRKLLINDYSFLIIFNGLLDPEYEVISEAVVCMSNLAAVVNESELEQLLELGVFSKIEKLIKCNLDVLNYFGREILNAVDKLLRKTTASQMNDIRQTGLEAAIDSLILNENCSEIATRLIDLHFKEKEMKIFSNNASLIIEPSERVTVFTLEDVEPPVSVHNQPIPLPDNSNYPRVIDNIITTLKKHNPKFVNQGVVSTWTRHFKSPECRAVLSDMFWYCVVKIDKKPNLAEYKKSLLDRISYNYIQVFVNVPMQEKEIFFENFFDCIAQGVFYSMFFAYPKSRFRLNSEEFKSRLYEIVSKKITGISVKNQGFNNWVLELGAGNVLKRHSASQGGPRSTDRNSSNKGKSKARQTLQQLRYSPLVTRYLKSKRYEAINSVPSWNMRYTVRNIEKERETEKKHYYYKKLAHDTEKSSKERDLLFQETSSRIDEKIVAEHRKYRRFVNRITRKTKEVIKEGPGEYAKKLVSIDSLLGPDKKSGYISFSKLKIL